MTEFNFPLQKMQAEWKDLRPHHARGVLFFVLPQVDLMELAKAVAEDNKAYIMECLKEQRIFQKETHVVADWQEERVLSFVIVQPYIFVEYTNEHH